MNSFTCIFQGIDLDLRTSNLLNTSWWLLLNIATTTIFICLFIYLFIYSLFKVDLHLAYKKPINVNNNTAYIFVYKLPSDNDDNKTKYLIVRQNQHVANRLYITYMGNQAPTFLFFVWKILDYHNFWLFRLIDFKYIIHNTRW